MASSRPGPAIHARRGAPVPPCGVPAVVGVHGSPAMLPARHPARGGIEAVTTLRHLALEPRLGPPWDALHDRGQGIPNGPARAKALAGVYGARGSRGIEPLLS